MTLTDSRVLFKTPFNPITGYGRDGILLSRELIAVRADLHLEPRYVGLPLPPDVLPLFCKPRPEHFEIAINHEYPGEIGFPEEMHRYSDLTVGWTMYEFNGFSESNEMRARLSERLSSFDLVLAYDEVSREALRPFVDDPDNHIRILQGGYDSATWVPDEITRDWDGTFRFGMNGTMNARKNPWAAIHAFNTLKEEHGADFDAELHLKTTSLVFPPQMLEHMPGVKVHYASWTEEQLKEFYCGLNCLLAPSWGEGKNLPALEAQTTGCPVVVSAIGGHMQWADPSWCYLVSGPIEEHIPGEGSMRVDSDTMAEVMWHIYNNRHEARRKGELAATMIPQQCDWGNVVHRLDLMLDSVKRKNRG